MKAVEKTMPKGAALSRHMSEMTIHGREGGKGKGQRCQAGVWVGVREAGRETKTDEETNPATLQTSGGNFSDFLFTSRDLFFIFLRHLLIFSGSRVDTKARTYKDILGKKHVILSWDL